MKQKLHTDTDAGAERKLRSQAETGGFLSFLPIKQNSTGARKVQRCVNLEWNTSKNSTWNAEPIKNEKELFR